MSYQPKYTNEMKIEALLQIDIGEDSVPTSGQLLDIIERVDKDMDTRLLGVYTSENELVGSDGEAFIQPNFLPIIQVSRVEVNFADPSQKPDWQELVEGPGEGSSFIVVKKNFAGKLLGIGLYFYDNIPPRGRARIRVTYTYGFNFEQKILEEYATKRVALEVLIVRSFNENYRVDLSQGYMSKLYEELKTRVKELEQFFEKHVSIVMV
ncbi:MAG: hypothetical protein ACKD6N_03525 [Candidatus Bathyarchaeota archaeon]